MVAPRTETGDGLNPETYRARRNPLVAVGSGTLFEINAVWCMVPDVSEIGGLPVGDNVTVRGTFSESDGFDVVIKPCRTDPASLG